MKVSDIIAKFADHAVEVRRDIHSHPELSLKETRTTAKIKEELASFGVPLVDGLSIETGALAIVEGSRPGPTLMLRADIDALPVVEATGLPFASTHEGVCHACGHDIHTAALLLAARTINEMKADLAGRVVFIFQPAEEGGDGAKMVIASGLFEKYKADLIVGAHTWPEVDAGCVGLRRGPFMASADSFKITVRGNGGHGAHPHKSIDPIMTAAYILTELQTVVSRMVAPLDSAVLTVGKFVAGTAGNVIPDTAVMEGTVRTMLPATREKIEKRVRDVAEHGSAMMGAGCEVEYRLGLPPVFNDAGAVDKIERAAESSLGAEKITWLETPSMGSEDFSRYLDIAPGAMFRIGTGTDDAATRGPLHNARTVFDERAIATGATVMAELAREFLAAR